MKETASIKRKEAIEIAQNFVKELNLKLKDVFPKHEKLFKIVEKATGNDEMFSNVTNNSPMAETVKRLISAMYLKPFEVYPSLVDIFAKAGETLLQIHWRCGECQDTYHTTAGVFYTSNDHLYPEAVIIEEKKFIFLSEKALGFPGFRKCRKATAEELQLIEDKKNLIAKTNEAIKVVCSHFKWYGDIPCIME